MEKFLNNLSIPSNVKQAQRFIGFVNFYKDFIPKLSKKLLPFYKLLKNDVQFKISLDQEDSFKLIIEDHKKACNTSLRMPLPDKQFVIVTDASEHAAGYALMIEDYTDGQNTNGKKKSCAPVMFGSKTFNSAQMKYSAYTKEFLGLYFAFAAFRHIIWGNPKSTLVLTDNKSLTPFFQAKHMAPSLWNHIDFILQFDFMIAHIPGKTNQASDFLSRIATDPNNQIKMTINSRIPTYDVVIDGVQPNLPHTDADPLNPERVDEETLNSLMQLWQGSTEANSEDRKDILDAIVNICDPREITVSGLYNLCKSKCTPLNALSVEDSKKDWYRDNTPLTMEILQAKDPNVDKIKEWLLMKHEITPTTYPPV